MCEWLLFPENKLQMLIIMVMNAYDTQNGSLLVSITCNAHSHTSALYMIEKDKSQNKIHISQSNAIGCSKE